MTTPAVQVARGGPVTRKDVARYAGVSTAVVSYVVNGGPKKVAPATEAKVQDAIRVLGYRPNAAARALKLGSSETLGLVIPDNSNPFFSQFAHAVEDAAAALGYALVLSNSDGNVAKERRNVRNLAARQVDGVLLASVLFEPDLEVLETADIPAVLLNQERDAPGFNTIGVDLAAGARIAVEHLIGHGHTNIGLAMGTNVSGSLDGREVGWRQALQAAGLPEGPVVYSGFTWPGGYLAGQRLVASVNRPTAIFATSDTQAVGLLRAVHEAGLSIPGEIAVVSFDGSIEAEYSWPPLTTVEQPVAAMAEAAVAALVGATRGEKPQHRIFPTKLNIRQSCGCPWTPSTGVPHGT
ncbi:LacI family transcriptional regulator [Pseudarthrobacter phenanthrenivorans]|uniref:LacI family transcriptional regulator n=2 Tax=Pseudarthrobacter phenanthrenivorans TaxID=361575 RepID=A0A3B0FKC4_PSEPS|nr:LacI family DNA-binding transcriptional regulator [Pseudarthrobacter phenanthrenivorans]ADX74412.1 transcriptional regulator, LacI family [Pseudarthrobacter phenanthrenivorans Sphe3]RKO20315.1 LacI family transcriptional regulator [Pseudarthrobacter phenanthrenivorans]TPV52351.1 LacI family transcriptional regulator [Pseudarthrobacter phenanthrenivorans]